MADMAILQEIDKCMKCRGCQVACQRVQGLTTIDGNADTVQHDDPMVVKNQGTNDSPPYVRYSCWHCYNPPCVTACGKGAMKVSDTGAVYVDKTLCVPDNSPQCSQKCVRDCRKGGYPKVGTNAAGLHAYKCDLCHARTTDTTLPVAQRIPACVETCPAKALSYDTVANIQAKCNLATVDGYGQTGDVWLGEGHMYWASKNKAGVWATFNPPTTDPYIEDHISPMFDKVLKSPVGPALAVPAVFLGGLYAIIKRRMKLAEAEEV